MIRTKEKSKSILWTFDWLSGGYFYHVTLFGMAFSEVNHVRASFQKGVKLEQKSFWENQEELLLFVGGQNSEN